MANFSLHQLSSLLFVVFALISSYSLQVHAAEDDRKVYIVYMGHLPEADESLPSYHSKMLHDVVDSRFATKSLVRSYTRSFNGFAAYLTPQEKEKLASHEEVVSIYPSTTYKLQTTRSWEFMGLTSNVKRDPIMESNTIIGVIDSGIWPESESFNDKGFSPPPKKWKGACNGGYNFTCNNKLIGARYYIEESARDLDGHGTHTASTAAGNYVKDVSFYGIAKGTARGGVPSARIAAYKACDKLGLCRTEDLLAAFDDGISDGVDVFSTSIGPSFPLELPEDTIATGAFHATQKGILVIQSAGNDRSKKSIASVAPWIFSVAASSSDRGIIARVVLGDGTVLNGKAVNTVSTNGTSFPVLYGKGVSSQCNEESAKFCSGCLEPELVKGKIVMCNTFSGIGDAIRAGALGAVVRNNFAADVAFVVPSMPISALADDDFNLLETYINSTKSPKVEIMASESLANLDAPMVASFSSKGPSRINPDILKPDVTAPGTEVIAAYSPLSPPSYLFASYDKRSVKYTILAGTSMSCPHVAGASAYVKSMHPNWSPSAIKSALMTTAWRMDIGNDPLAEFAYGAGHIDPVKAIDPGLVYETSTEDYAKIFCSLGFDNTKMRKIFGENVICPTEAKTMPKDLNYPSMSFGITQGNTSVTFSVKFQRTVTNVGDANSTYKVNTSKSQDYRIVVEPDILKFEALNEKKSFEVTITGKISENYMVSASLEWSDGVRNVRSPIVLYTDNL